MPTRPALLLALGLFLTLAAPALTAPEIEAVDLGPVLRGTHPAVLGMDGAYSLPLGKGRSLWVFGDTLLGSWRPDGSRVMTGMPSNTAAVVSDREWVTGFAGARFVGGKAPEPLLMPSSPGVRVWPLDAIASGARTAHYFVEIQATGKGPLDFKTVGTGVVMRQSPTASSTRDVMLWPGEAPLYGTSVLRHRGTTYLYAGGAQTFLARARGPLERADSYEYWAGGRWERDWRKASALPPSGPEMSVRYNPYLQSCVWIALPPFSHTVEARYAPEPWGPWSEPLRLIDCSPSGPGPMFYGAKQHAELDGDLGRTIVLSYNTNAPEPMLTARPDLYWPHLVRITFRRPAKGSMTPAR